jgi:hypothetical protein
MVGVTAVVNGSVARGYICFRCLAALPRAALLKAACGIKALDRSPTGFDSPVYLAGVTEECLL